ncbi:MAG: hypothetical protein JW841_04620 [Deltaproteobacteria bacterium]|nr:hypothetical protein [Deltaproteobacteria bacterium]
MLIIINSLKKSFKSTHHNAIVATLALVIANIFGCSKNNDVSVMEQRPLIANIQTDRTEACIGDDVLVTVIALEPDPRLEVYVDGALGNPRVVTVSSIGVQKVGVTVSLGPNVRDFSSVEFKGIDCGEQSTLDLSYRFSTDRADTVIFNASVNKIEPSEILYLWDFGEGTTITTTSGMVEKSYAMRDQNKAMTTFIASVTATIATGQSLQKRISVALKNLSFAASEDAIVVLPVEHERFATQQGNIFSSLVQMKNTLSSSVTFSNLVAMGRSCDGEQMPQVTLDLANSFASPPLKLLAGQVWSSQISLTQSNLGDNVCTARLILSGASESGQKVRAGFALDLKVPQLSSQVTDTQIISKIEAAREILGRKRVTIEELNRLEAEGLL